MPIVTFTQDDINRNKIVTPSWYRVKIKKVTAKLAKSQQTTNYWIEGSILCDADTGDETFKDVPTPYLFMFNSAAMGKAAPFISACIGEEVKPETRYELDHSTGKLIEMFIGNQLYEGSMQNVVTGQFRPAKQAA